MYLVEYLAKNQQLFVDNEISTEVLKTIKGDLLQLEEFKNLDKLIISDEGDFIHTKHRACNFNGTFILSKFMLTPTLYKLEDNNQVKFKAILMKCNMVCAYVQHSSRMNSEEQNYIIQ